MSFVYASSNINQSLFLVRTFGHSLRSRCNDKTVQFKKLITDTKFHHAITTINKEWNSEFTKALTDYTDKTITLAERRKGFCTNQANNFENKGHTSSVLKNVTIWEEVADEVLSANIKILLNHNYKIPQSQTDTTELELIEIVKKGRDEKINIVPNFIQLLNLKKANAPTIEINYKKRNEEDDLFQELESNNLLLLTGISLCGKSELAKQVAFLFFAKGYNYTINSDLQAISQFFSQNPVEDKIAILEDPWGHLEKTPQALSDWKRVENFLSNVPANHKVIITSRREIIQNIHSTKEINRKKLKGTLWHDLTLTNSEFLLEYWNNITERRELSSEVCQNIKRHLLTVEGEEKLQIGQLQFLAGSDASDLIGKTVGELEHIARMNSQEIGESLRNKDVEIAELVSLLALTSTTTTGVHKRELANVLSNDKNLYSKTEKTFWSSGLEDKVVNYPQYDTEPSLPLKSQQDLEYLERRFLINEKEGYIFFTHPNYLEAGRYLFTDPSNAGQNRFLSRVEKALFSIHPDTTFLTANQFPFLAKRFSGNYLSILYKLSFEGLDSIYPAVEDQMTIFLIECMSQLSEEQQRSLVHHLEVGGVSSSHIYWFEERIPFINTQGRLGLEEYFFKMEEEKFTVIEDAFSRNELVASYSAWQYILVVQNSPTKKISEKVLGTLLQYREVFLRERAVFIFIRDEKESLNLNGLNKIFIDEHPSVIFEGIRGCFLFWRGFSKEIKEYLITLFRELLNKPAIAIRANNLMTTFAKEHQHDGIDWEFMKEGEKKELWNLWGILFPIFIKQVSSDTFLNPGRFGLTMEESLKYLEYDTGLKVLEAWYERIDYRIKKSKYPDEYEMAIARDLMEFTKTDYINRKGLFEKLISYPKTGFLVSNLK